jgi:hypothetical protein
VPWQALDRPRQLELQEEALVIPSGGDYAEDEDFNMNMSPLERNARSSSAGDGTVAGASSFITEAGVGVQPVPVRTAAATSHSVGALERTQSATMSAGAEEAAAGHSDSNPESAGVSVKDRVRFFGSFGKK